MCTEHARGGGRCLRARPARMTAGIFALDLDEGDGLSPKAAREGSDDEFVRYVVQFTHVRADRGRGCALPEEGGPRRADRHDKVVCVTRGAYTTASLWRCA